MKFGLSKYTLAQLSEVLVRNPKVEKVLIYGSRAKGTEKPGSDIDLAIFAPDMDRHEFSALWSELDDLPIVFKLDVVHFDALDEGTLKQAIASDGIALFTACP